MQIKDKGATPIEKNIIVVDEQGNEYEATYPKRAKGLVKNGRARFINENTICLACPPMEYLEDNKMENKNTQSVDISYILEQIKAIQEQTEYLNTALDNLAKMSDGNSGDMGSPGNIQGQAKAQAYADIVKCRETTNQQLLRFYEKMYDDIKPRKPSNSDKIFEFVNKIVEDGYENTDEIISLIDEFRKI